MQPAPPPRWRPMRPQDLAAVGHVAAAVHPHYPEDAAVLAERLHLYPAGCFVLVGEQGVAGYALAHPWLFGQPPALNTLLHHLAAPADCLHIHDVALMEAARGAGLGANIADRLARQALKAGLATMSLVAVGGALRFWSALGFAVMEPDAGRETLASYGAEAVFMARRLPRWSGIASE